MRKLTIKFDDHVVNDDNSLAELTCEELRVLQTVCMQLRGAASIMENNKHMENLHACDIRVSPGSHMPYQPPGYHSHVPGMGYIPPQQTPPWMTQPIPPGYVNPVNRSREFEDGDFTIGGDVVGRMDHTGGGYGGACIRFYKDNNECVGILPDMSENSNYESYYDQICILADSGIEINADKGITKALIDQLFTTHMEENSED